ncbi:MAG: beta-propeller fold lactonase family protein [Clostridia bacterium]|nr:beta-propeller fold lactonase family protein [Clostridia bacterium]
MGYKTIHQIFRGFDKIRQESPHTHFTMRSPDKKNILCTDLGLDTLFLYDEDLNKKFSVNVPNGKGIRHICFSEDGKYFYSVNELSNDVSVFYYNGGKPLLKGTYSAIPDFKGKSTAAAIRIKEDNLYISNRGADTISRFKICKEELILLENTPCGGKSPRDFDFVGDYIFCTNEKTNNLTVLKLENRKPLLTDISADVESPVCISTI